MTKMVYLVTGKAGIGEDYDHWTVCAFLWRPAAERLAAKLEKRGNTLLMEYRAYAARQDRAGKSWQSPTNWLASKRSVPDPRLHLAFNGGVTYAVIAIPLRRRAP